MTAFVDEHRGRFGVEPICRTLGVSASAYYQRQTRRRSERQWRTSGCSAGSARLQRRRTEPAVGRRPRLLRCWEGLVFLAYVLDAYSRKVVGWQLALHMLAVVEYIGWFNDSRLHQRTAIYHRPSSNG